MGPNTPPPGMLNPQGMPPQLNAPQPPMQVAAAGAQNAGDAAKKQAELNAFKSYLETLPEEEREPAIMEFVSNQTNKRSQATEAMSKADAIRNAKGPQMGRDYGGYMVAASPFEHAMSGISKYKGEKDYQKASAEQRLADAMSDKKRALGLKLDMGDLSPYQTPPINPMPQR